MEKSNEITRSSLKILLSASLKGPRACVNLGYGIFLTGDNMDI